MVQLKDKHVGQRCYIVGTGLSVLNLTKESFKDGIVIAMNSAIKIVEALNMDNMIYSMQKDIFEYLPQKAVLLLHKHESAIRGHVDYDDKIVFDNEWLGLSRGSFDSGFSLQSAIKLSEYMGCSDVKIYGCDSHVNGDIRRINYDGLDKDENYPKMVAGMKNFKTNIHYEFCS